MLVRSWLDALKSHFTRQPTRRQRRAARLGGRSRHLHVEPLEDRRLMAFDTAVSYHTGSYTNGVVVADFNNDGQLDLASASSSSSSVSVLLGNADGTFQPAEHSATDSDPQSLAVGDFNADGQPDLVTQYAAGVSVLLGNGTGGFSAPANIGVGFGNEVSVAVGDFNADGKLDLGVLTNYSDSYGASPYSYLHVLLGNGDGSFADFGLSYLGGGYHYSAVAADFNADGKLDIAATSDSGTVEVALGHGSGWLGLTGSYWVGYDSYAVAAGDINGDGQPSL